MMDAIVRPLTDKEVQTIVQYDLAGIDHWQKSPSLPDTEFTFAMVGQPIVTAVYKHGERLIAIDMTRNNLLTINTLKQLEQIFNVVAH